jgi:hypothetical protein
MTRLVAACRLELVDAPLLLDDRRHLRLGLAPLAARPVAAVAAMAVAAAAALALALALGPRLLRLWLRRAVLRLRLRLGL